MSAMTLGNGRLRIRFDGIRISGIFGDALFGELICALVPALHVSSQRIPGCGILQHEIVSRDIAPKLTITKRRAPECRVTDLLLPDAPFLVRMIEAVDSLSFSPRPAEGVSFRLLPDYMIGRIKTTVGVFSLPKGGAPRGSLLYLIPLGSAHFDEDGILHAEPGFSSLILAAGDCPSEIISSSAKLAKLLDQPCAAAASPLFGYCLEGWQRRLAVMPPDLRDSYCEETAMLLLAGISPDGRILTEKEGGFPFSDVPPIIEALARLGFIREARAVADRIFSHYKAYGFAKGLSRGTPTAMADAQLACYSATGDGTFLKERLPMLIDAAMVLHRELNGGLLSFCGDERLFLYKMLHPQAIEQASASAVLRYIRIADAVIGFVKKHQLRSRKGYFEALTEGCASAKAALMREFFSDGMLWENNPRRLRHQRKPRFTYGICEVCGGQDHLERDGQGHYTCLNCFGKTPSEQSYPRRIPAIMSLELLCGGFCCDVIPDEILDSLLCTHAESLLDGGFSLWEGGTEGIILRLMAERIASGSGNDELRRLCRELYEHTVAKGVIRAGCYRKDAPPIDEGDPAATARCMLGLLAAKNI